MLGRATLIIVIGLVGVAASEAVELNPGDMVLLDRLTWGINASSAAHLQAVGSERWLQGQLHPAPNAALPDAARKQIDAMPDVHKFPFDIAVSFDQQAKSANQVADPDQRRAAQQVFQQAMNDRAKQAAARSILHALYAPDQLRERMTWFWFNHFNVHQYKANIRILVGDYEDHAIRPHALGKFRDLLLATLHHPAMLLYLDNADNAVGHLNENYAREIMELHTMGVDDRQAALIKNMYAKSELASSVSEGFRVRDDVYKSISEEMTAANRGAVSPRGFELSARRIGRLMREQFNLGFVDVGGWDTHVNQGAATGYLADRLGELGRALAGFSEEIGPAGWRDTVVVVISEFGRTFRENGDRGTDHGHGSVYWVMGGGINGGRILGEQVKVDQANLFQNRDYPVLTDYRAMFAGLFQRMFGLEAASVQRMFAGAHPVELGLV